jgi:uncharacterized low-complexity protein
MIRPRLLAASVAALALLTAAVASASAHHTQAHIYNPFTASGSPAKHVTKTVHGSCWEGSLAAGRSDAWRCMSGNFIYDPCFSSAKASGIVLCANAPWSNKVIEIKLTKGLPTSMGNPHGASTKGLPWALQTTSGKKCQLVTGATSAIGKNRANYVCGKSKDWLWGNPIRSSQPWKIFTAHVNAKKLSRKVGIKAAWF